MFHATIGGAGQEMFLWTQRPGTTDELRALGCALVLAMPEDGMLETLQGLWEVFEFRNELQALPRALRETTTSQGQAIDSLDRPKLVISD